MNEIRQGDALETLESIPADSVDCIVTSPPYWGLRNYGIAGQIGVESQASDFIDSFAGIASELARVLTSTGSFWLNLGDTYNGSSIIRDHGRATHPRKGDDEYNRQLADNRSESGVMRRSASQYGLPRRARLQIPDRVAIELGNAGWILRDEVIWYKPHPKPEGRVSTRLRQSHEKIFRFVRSENATFHRDAIADQTDVWRIDTASDSDHPAPFPAEIPRRAIELTTDDGDTVLDPFAGTGTTCRIAKKLGRNYLGIELNPDFARIARSRISSIDERPNWFQSSGDVVDVD